MGVPKMNMYYCASTSKYVNYIAVKKKFRI